MHLCHKIEIKSQDRISVSGYIGLGTSATWLKRTLSIVCNM
jgi:hypothetical protein